MNGTLFSRTKLAVFISFALLGPISCGGGGSDSSPTPTPDPAPAPTPTQPPTTGFGYTNVTSSALPDGLEGACMDGAAGDVDGDGDDDIILALENQQNVLLTNNNGAFSLSNPFTDIGRDSEDMVLADLDGDGDLDVFFASEDDMTNELYLNQGNGSFSDVSTRIPSDGRSNAVTALDVNNDGSLDLIIANNGIHVVLINDGNANFSIADPAIDLGSSTAQDVEVADVDGDGDLDIMFGNENRNSLFINNGDGTFTDETQNRLPDISDETRDIEFGDIDNDGDLDVFVSNVAFFGTFEPTNYILVNDGTGVFTRVDIPPMNGDHADSDFIDVDGDGDLDIMSSSTFLGGDVGAGTVLFNDGSGVFEVRAFNSTGNTFDIVQLDANGDNKTDLYYCNRRASNPSALTTGGQDQLFLKD